MSGPIDRLGFPVTRPAPDTPGSTHPTRTALLASAAALFGESGYDGASIRDVERRAGVNRNLVAHYFGTKDELWRAAVDWLMLEFADELERYGALAEIVAPKDRPPIFLKVFLRFTRRHPEFIRLILIECGSPTWRAEVLLENMRRLDDFFRRTTDASADRSNSQKAISHSFMFGAAAMFATPNYLVELFGSDPWDESFEAAYADAVAEIWRVFG